MQEVGAYGIVATTLGLVLARPRVGPVFRLSPALAAFLGVAALFVSGALHLEDVAEASLVLWRPLLAITSIMVMSAACERLGVLSWLVASAERRATMSTVGLFAAMFLIAQLCSVLLNNDTTVLLLTPATIAFVRRRYPNRPELLVPFAFAVFMAAGVAPLVVSNPMNMIVATYAHIGFNEYAIQMAPIAAAGSVVSFLVMLLLFRRELFANVHSEAPAPSVRLRGKAHVHAFVLLVAVVVTYPVAAYLGAPVWIIAVIGAVLSCLLAARQEPDSTVGIAKGISWDTLAFLFAVFLLGAGVKNAGFVRHLAALYGSENLIGIGLCSAVGSALLNNHPMAMLNVFALQHVPSAGSSEVFAALIGGDLGPRLLPIGSLAGLLWLASLRAQGVPIRLGRFVLVGIIATIPALILSLLMLARA